MLRLLSLYLFQSFRQTFRNRTLPLLFLKMNFLIRVLALHGFLHAFLQESCRSLTAKHLVVLIDEKVQKVHHDKRSNLNLLEVLLHFVA